MSSKTQYKDAIKRANSSIREWKDAYENLSAELVVANHKVSELKKQLRKLNIKKWWQIWI